MNLWLMALVALIIVVVPCAAVVLFVRVFNGPDGERYRRQQMQGPFVPLGAEENDGGGVKTDHQTAD